MNPDIAPPSLSARQITENRISLQQSLMERVSILARARSALSQDRQPSIGGALRQVCEALHAQAEPRSILISMQVEQEVHGLSPHQITTLALVVNELATNAIKHAFEEGKSGHIRITAGGSPGREVTIMVDDDGLPFPEATSRSGDGLGLGLVKRLVASIGGLFIPPPPGSKVFEIRVAVQSGGA
ncbi:sensor histidine kinase [Brevundimonas sp. 'scallop']|uniref:ATP-binding protein n=1 Tax=Brevundimonas sp. 'scallop' TaxID=2562582 RepID=UPI0013EDBD80|nr:sensor histidine kinase [Brevundimonas sp. 'scallop']